MTLKTWLKARFPQPYRHLRRLRFGRTRVKSFADHYLAETGWTRSALEHLSVDHYGPLPWITYPAIRVLERVVRPHHRVFEFGCGNSSLWWAKQVSQVVSVEHNTYWVEHCKKTAPDNLALIAKPIDECADSPLLNEFLSAYPAQPSLGNRDQDILHGLLTKEFSAYALDLTRYPKGHFDIIVVDGMARSFTAFLAARYVKDDGFIVFDNSGRWQYNAGYDALAKEGFKRLDFYGPAPVIPWESCTSIFCKTLDWLSHDAAIPETSDPLR